GLAQIADTVEAAFRGLVAIGQALGIVFDTLLLAVKTVVAAAKPALGVTGAALAFASGNVKLANAYMKQFSKDASLAAGFVGESWKKATQDIADHWHSLTNSFSGNVGDGGASLPELPDLSRGNGRLGKGIQEALSGETTGASATSKLSDAASKLQATVRKMIKGTSDELAAGLQQNAAKSVEAWEAAQRALQEYGDTEQQQVATQKLVNEQIAILNDTLLPELIKQHVSLADAQKIVVQKAKDMAGGVKDSTDQMSQFAKQAANNKQDAFADFLFDPLKDGLKGLLGSFIDTFRRLATQALAANIFDSLV